MSPRRRHHPMVVLALGLALFAGLATPASAAEEPGDDAPVEAAPVDPEPDGRPPISLRLSPAVLEVPPGGGISRHELRVDNTGSQPIRVVTETAGFRVTPDGTTHFDEPGDLSAASWVTVDTPEFSLDPDDRRDVTVTVDVPEDAEPGERYVSVLFVVPGTDGEGNITVTHRVAVKLMIAVPGPQNHQLELGELTAPRFVDSGAAHFDLEVRNRGNMHRRFETPDPLMATSGDAAFRFENFTVLGASTRVVEAIWPDPPTVCWCTVDVAVDDGQGNLVTASTRVVMFPLRLTLAMLALTAGLAMVLAGRRRRRAERLERQLEAAREQGARSASPGGAATAPGPAHRAPAPPAAAAPPGPAAPDRASAPAATLERPTVTVSRVAQNDLDRDFFMARPARRHRSR